MADNTVENAAPVEEAPDLRKLFIQLDDNGNIVSEVTTTADTAPEHPNQVEMPIDTDTKGMMYDAKTQALKPIVYPADSLAAFEQKYPGRTDIIAALKDPTKRAQLIADAGVVAAQPVISIGKAKG